MAKIYRTDNRCGNGVLPDLARSCRLPRPFKVPHDYPSSAGDRKYKIPNLNPLSVYDFRVSQGTRQVGLKIHMKEAIIHGLPELNFDAAR